MSASVAYVAASTNRFTYAADISPDSLVALGSGKLVALWDINDANDPGVQETLTSHEGMVTCVRFISENTFVSTDDKGMLLCWRKFGSQWKRTGKVEAHTAAVSTLCVHDGRIVTGSSDALVKIWKIDSCNETDQLNEEQTITLRGRYPLAVALAYLPQTKVSILAISGTDTNVQLWLRSDDNFVQSAVLAGHEDWIRGLAFLPPAAKDQSLVLASGSQDATIRLWNIESCQQEESLLRKQPAGGLSDELLDAFEASLAGVGDAEEGGRQISLKRHILTVKLDTESSQQFSVTFDALLVGHEAGVTALSWRTMSSSTSTPTLLSTSTDSSLILWSPSKVSTAPQDGSASIWINRQRFGDIGGQRLGGFVGGLWGRAGSEAMAWGWAGGWRRWCCKDTNTDNSAETWVEVGAISGHSGPVKGLDWCPGGEYLISAGLDQTTRVHGSITGKEGRSSWHELNRPQVHGYDLLDVAFLESLRFASIADEKVTRVFEAPQSFVDLVDVLGVARFAGSKHIRPAGASLPPLGLSNKAVSEDSSRSTVELKLSRRPFEGELASSTLWPEIEKVFGHGYESVTLGVSKSRKLIATACKATSPEHAVLRVYDTDTYRSVGQPLQGHSLTVTGIAFSPDDKLILSVSRDRSWRIFGMQEDGGYAPVASDKSHGRIIWDCAWSAEGDVFATASRDKTVKIWKRGDGNQWTNITTMKTKMPATAVAFSAANTYNRKVNERQLAIGLENGEILIYSGLSTASAEWKFELTISCGVAHIDHIHRLAWRPTFNGARELASCSEDGTLKILIVQLATD